MIINIIVRSSYGRDLYYCLNETVCQLVGKKTLDVRDRKNLIALGHSLVIEREPLREAM
jgi:hypothetical protein